MPCWALHHRGTAMTATIRVVVADDHPVLIEGIKSVLEAQPSITVVGVARNFEQVPSVLEATQPHVLILDLTGMGEALFGMMQRLGRDFPSVGVVIFSSYLSYAAELIELGVRGYVTKVEMSSDLVNSVLAVAHGDIACSPLVVKHLEQTRADIPFSPREHLAIRLYLQGMETPEIATEMSIRGHSVQNLFNSMFAKTGCRSRRELAALYLRVYGNPFE